MSYCHFVRIMIERFVPPTFLLKTACGGAGVCVEGLLWAQGNALR